MNSKVYWISRLICVNAVRNRNLQCATYCIILAFYASLGNFLQQKTFVINKTPVKATTKMPYIYHIWRHYNCNVNMYMAWCFFIIHYSKYVRKHVCSFIPHSRRLIQLYLLKCWVKQWYGRMLYTTVSNHLQKLWTWPYVHSVEKSSLFL